MKTTYTLEIEIDTWRSPKEYMEIMEEAKRLKKDVLAKRDGNLIILEVNDEPEIGS